MLPSSDSLSRSLNVLGSASQDSSIHTRHLTVLIQNNRVLAGIAFLYTRKDIVSIGSPDAL